MRTTVRLLTLVTVLAFPGWSAAAGWSTVPIPEHLVLNSVSCRSSHWCLAVGRSRGGPVLARWDGRRWSPAGTPLTPGRFPAVDAVECTSTRSCLAVGSHLRNRSVSSESPLAERWNGSRWSLQSAPEPRGHRAFFNAVACPGSRTCFAVGWANRNRVWTGFIDHWDGTRWTLMNAPASPGGLSSISCTSTRACTAVGGFENYVGRPDEGDQHWELGGEALRWDGQRWSRQELAPPPGAVGAVPFGVSCVTTRSCVTVGDTRFDAGPNSTDQTLVGDWTGASWSTQVLPPPAGLQRGGTYRPDTRLFGVSCSSGTDCGAVGQYIATNGAIGPLAAHWDGSRWTQTDLRRGPVALDSVSCPVDGWCMAVGDTIAERYSR